MALQLQYGEKTYNLEAREEEMVRNQFHALAQSPTGLGLLDFTIMGTRYTLLGGVGIHTALLDFGQ